MSAAGFVLLALGGVMWLVTLSRVSLVAARMFQIEEYEARRFFRWGRERAWLAHRAVLLGTVVATGGPIAAALRRDDATLAAGIAWIAASVGATWWWRWTPPKRTLVLTSRMRRILSGAAVLALILASVPILLAAFAPPVSAAVAVLVLMASLSAVALVVLAGGDLLMRPVERGVQRRYLRAAARTMQDVRPLVVAIAGSYGKTSTKHILAHLLNGQVEVLPTRKSFNTLMGVTRVINEDLKQKHRVFIVEMDAYAPGEIAAICDLVHPSISVLTSVGPQHLERFRSMTAIRDALYEVMAGASQQAAAFIHSGDDGGAALAERATSEARAVTRYGIEGITPAPDVIATGVRVTSAGSQFVWRWPAHDLEREVTIPLLGQHQVLNVSVALAVVHQLGYSIDVAIAAAASLQPVEHRLQVMPTDGPVTVIDNSYNANPVGVHNGLDVLAAMNGRTKVLVTPGLVELGSEEEAENRRYGEHAAAVCDHVIVVAARPAAALAAGLKAGGLADERIHVVRDLREASAVITRVTQAGAVVLFANDLPDTYLANT